MNFGKYLEEKRKSRNYIQNIIESTEVVLYEVTNNAGILYEYKYLLKHIENDLKEE